MPPRPDTSAIPASSWGVISAPANGPHNSPASVTTALLRNGCLLIAPDPLSEEVDRLQPVIKGQLQHKVRHHNVGATIAAVLTTGIDGEFRRVKVKTEFTGHLAPLVITPEPEITAINHCTAGVQVQVGRAVIANGNIHLHTHIHALALPVLRSRATGTGTAPNSSGTPRAIVTLRSVYHGRGDEFEHRLVSDSDVVTVDHVNAPRIQQAPQIHRSQVRSVVTARAGDIKVVNGDIDLTAVRALYTGNTEDPGLFAVNVRRIRAVGEDEVFQYQANPSTVDFREFAIVELFEFCCGRSRQHRKAEHKE